MIGRNDACWCGSGIKWKKCHYPQLSQIQKENPKDVYLKKYGIHLKTPEQIDGIRASCQLASRILDEVCQKAQVGITTLELNDYAEKLHREAGAIAAPFHYGSPPFPKSICTSLNDVICHGIPDATVLKEGDILNIDVTCILNGFYGDCSRMVSIGHVSSEKKLVSDVSYECLIKAIDILKPNIPISSIGEVIERHAHSRGCSVVYQFVGHGVGIKFHESPSVPHVRNKIQTLLVPGMTFTIEPMINAGKPEAIIDTKDHWTARTPDGRPSAQWEHTVLITESGHEVLTTWRR